MIDIDEDWHFGHIMGTPLKQVHHGNARAATGE
jgi:hypothetical protein